ncbi:MAG: hydroxyacylglutathione hydrolase [Legionellales bacterium]|nr:hydroxyacylglutathione hydrolase [Legionellales bacterium]
MDNFYITPVKTLRDNYVWIMVNKQNQHCLIVDPGEALPVLSFILNNNLIPDGILITHHHHDHTDGITGILSHYAIPVYGYIDNRVATITHHVEAGSVIRLEKMGCIINILYIPGHTLDHIAFHFDHALFCGDTLFSGGCGRVFEGSYEQMFSSLEKIAALPDETKIYCAHEYTLANLRFAETIDQDNQFLEEYITYIKSLTHENKCTLPSTLETEKKMNPFLRCKNQHFVAQLSKQKNITFKNEIEVFKYIRELKNYF